MTKKSLSEDKILHTANLCRLQLTVDESEKLGKMLAQTIEYIDVLNELDTSSVVETFQVTGLTNIFQEEKCISSQTLSSNESLQNAFGSEDDLFVTKAVFNR